MTAVESRKSLKRKQTVLPTYPSPCQSLGWPVQLPQTAFFGPSKCRLPPQGVAYPHMQGSRTGVQPGKHAEQKLAAEKYSCKPAHSPKRCAQTGVKEEPFTQELRTPKQEASTNTEKAPPERLDPPAIKGESQPSPTGVGKDRFNKGVWSPEEDNILQAYVASQGEGKWNRLKDLCGLQRSGKSCRLRYVNHLRPNLVKWPFSRAELEAIKEAQKEFGNKWAVIAKHFPGRTDNDIKNAFHTMKKRRARKRALEQASSSALQNLNPLHLSETSASAFEKRASVKLSTQKQGFGDSESELLNAEPTNATEASEVRSAQSGVSCEKGRGRALQRLPAGLSILTPAQTSAACSSGHCSLEERRLLVGSPASLPPGELGPSRPDLDEASRHVFSTAGRPIAPALTVPGLAAFTSTIDAFPSAFSTCSLTNFLNQQPPRDLQLPLQRPAQLPSGTGSQAETDSPLKRPRGIPPVEDNLWLELSGATTTQSGLSSVTAQTSLSNEILRNPATNWLGSPHSLKPEPPGFTNWTGTPPTLTLNPRPPEAVASQTGTLTEEPSPRRDPITEYLKARLSPTLQEFDPQALLSWTSPDLLRSLLLAGEDVVTGEMSREALLEHPRPRQAVPHNLLRGCYLDSPHEAISESGDSVNYPPNALFPKPEPGPFSDLAWLPDYAMPTYLPPLESEETGQSLPDCSDSETFWAGHW